MKEEFARAEEAALKAEEKLRAIARVRRPTEEETQEARAAYAKAAEAQREHQRRGGR